MDNNPYTPPESQVADPSNPAIGEQEVELGRAAVRSAPWMFLISIAVVIATFAYNKLFILALLLGPVVGLVGLILDVFYWRTKNKSLEAISRVAFMMLGMQAALKGGLVWGLPQALAVAFMFTTFPLILFGSRVLRWAHGSAQQAVPADRPKTGSR